MQRDSREIQLEMKPIQAEQNDQNSHDDVEVDDDLIAEFDSPVLKTKSLAEIYERCNVMVNEPSSYEEASKMEEWRIAMQEELKMIAKNETWQLVPRPSNRKIIGVKWVYRTKLNPNGSINKYKARLVVKGYSQVAGVDFGDTLAPVARHETIRLLAALSAQHEWRLYHLDVKSAFLNGNLQEEIYVEQPPGYVISRHESDVYRLHKALYGLKQAPRAWYSRVDTYFLQNGFKMSQNEATLYVKTDGNGSKIIVSLYVDDLLVTGNNDDGIIKFKESMLKEFEMTDLGVMNYFLGMEVHQLNDGIFLSQRKYAMDVLRKFKMESCKPVSTPLAINEKLTKSDGDAKADESNYRSLVGSLLYLTVARPDLMYPSGIL